MLQQPHYYLTAVCNSSRTQAIVSIEESIQKHGTILDFNLFSDISLAMVIEIPGNKIPNLINALQSIVQLDENTDIIQNSIYQVYLNISFTQGTGDLRHRISEVPG